MCVWTQPPAPKMRRRTSNPSTADGCPWHPCSYCALDLPHNLSVHNVEIAWIHIMEDLNKTWSKIMADYMQKRRHACLILEKLGRGTTVRRWGHQTPWDDPLVARPPFQTQESCASSDETDEQTWDEAQKAGTSWKAWVTRRCYVWQVRTGPKHKKWTYYDDNIQSTIEEGFSRHDEEVEVYCGDFPYTINFTTMQQKSTTGTLRAVRRATYDDLMKDSRP